MKPFTERLATALRTDRSNCETLRELIAEVEAEAAGQRGIQQQAQAESVDVTLNAGERDEAAVLADRAKRLACGYDDALETLRSKLEAKLASERRQYEAAERDAALAERDVIASRFAVEVPKALGILTDLFREVEVNRVRLQAARIYERDAEAQARDVPGNFMRGSAPVDRFTAMKIPAWSGSGRAWPIDPAAAERALIAETEHRQRVELQRRKSPEARAAAEAAQAAEEAKWLRYRVSHSKPGFVEVDCRTGTASLMSVDRVVLEMTEQQVAAARSKGVKVAPAGADDRSTLEGTLTLSERF